MIWTLRLLFLAILVGMLSVTTWASLQVPLWEIPREVGGHVWMIAALTDAYFGFLTFYCWVAYKVRSWGARLGWLIAILLLGNIAMASFMLIELFRVPATASVREVLLRRDA
jgi:hypothetical protein